MKLIDIASKINKNNQCSVPLNELTIDLGVNTLFGWTNPDSLRLKGYWINKKEDSYSEIGYRMYFLDEKPVSYSVQRSKYQPELFHWFGKEEIKKVRDYIISISLEQDDNFSICSINEEIMVSLTN